MPTLVDQLKNRLDQAGITYTATNTSVTVGPRSATLRTDCRLLRWHLAPSPSREPHA